MRKLALVIVALSLTGCLGYPKSVTPITGFDVNDYLGTWYEIARLDHSFERGLEQVTADYSLRDDGGIKVTNRGYLPTKDKWKEAIGKAYFVEDENKGYLKVSFFGPFYGSYVIFELEPDYQYAFVSGPDTSYLWFLSRTPEVDESLKKHFINKAENLGFDPKELIWVNQ